MKLRQIIDLLHADIIVGNDRIDQLEVDRCFSADLMSDVLGRAHANGIMLTGVTNPQAIRTADIADIMVVCVVRGKQPESETVALAKQRSIPLLTTKFTMFEACGILYVNGLKGVPERQ